MEIRKVGSILAGTAMLGAALSAPVLAGMDSTGITKGFFYDTNFKPIVKIVVGEKGMATDAVAAGNIAATVGNLAYMTKTVTPGGTSYEAEGQVVITTAARGAVGDYVQDTDINEATEDFYDEDEGFQFEGEKTYEKGDFTSYTLACDKQTRTEAGLLMEGSYSNIHCLFCQNLCLEALENPSHDMKETITIDSEGIRYYESGLGDDDSESLKMSIDKGSVIYTVETDFIPMKRITQNEGGDADDYIDFEYRGKMVLLGEEYYVKDIDGDKIYLSQAKVLDDVTSEGFTAEYNGYKFKVDHLIYAAEFKVAGILLDVEKPDGTRVQVQISKMANGVVDDLEISGVTAEEAASLQSASIIVYDLSTQVILEDGEDLELEGEVKTDWEVEFDVVNTCEEDADCDIDEYDVMDGETEDALLKQITVTYNHDLDGDEALEKDESLMFPKSFRLTYKGYLTNDYEESPCSGAGEGNILVEKGDDAHELIVSFTGEDGNRYNEVRLDEGPFKKNDLFMVNGVLYTYDSYDDEDGDTDAEDEREVTLDPQIRGNKVKIENIQRYCDPDDEGDPEGATYTGQDCEDIGDIDIRLLALTDALKDDTQPVVTSDSDYENDDVLTLDSYDLFIKEDAVSGLDVLFDDGDNSIFFADDFDTDRSIGVNADMVGVFDDFEVDGYDLELSVIVEDGLADDPNSVNLVAADDVNDDGDDDDTIVVFETDDGDVYIDLCDRNYDDDADNDYSTSVALYDVAGVLVEDTDLDEDTDTLLITPEGGDQFTIDWGTDDRVDAVELCHPEDDVDSTYFIGTVEEETVAESTITKADEGKEVSAGCCTFTVSKFEVTAGEATTDSTATAVVNPITGDMVVPEIAVSGDTSSNLVIVGGPAVNTMCTVTADEISAADDQFVVRKDGNMVIVAGWSADDTVTAGNELIKWLKANVHA